jgi:L-glutamine:2-deoxy-scyllo-inosose/3-amino-2,3-dideoxy-scyllo-inosose aminotransferase
MSNKLAIQGGSPVRDKPFSPWPIFGDVERDGLMRALESRTWGFNGPLEAEFAQQFADFQGVKHVLCASNGSVTLELALKALGIGPGDEVIVPALTWLATAWCAIQVGATPIFADVREGDWCLDPADVRRKITPRTRCIIPVHLYSQLAQMHELLAIAKEHDLRVIEDCAHTHGSQWQGQAIGGMGDIGSFSFQHTKGMTAGEGGALTTNDDSLADAIFSLKNCGRSASPDKPTGFGSNNRITEFQAAVLLGQLSRLSEQIATRAGNIIHLREQLDSIDGINVLAAKPEVTRQGMYCLSMTIDPKAIGDVPRDVFVNALREEGIPVTAPYEIVYESELWQPGVDLWKFPEGKDAAAELGIHSQCPVAERVSGETGVVLAHQSLLGDRADTQDIADAFEKVVRLSGQLRWKAMDRKLRSGVKKLLRMK